MEVVKAAKQLVDVVTSCGVNSVAIVGTAKNVGKTVTMTYLISELTQRGFKVGLISSGYDGETVDTFTGLPKPEIIVPPGAWVVTAEGVLKTVGANLKIADVLERRGLFGRLVVAKAIDPVSLELVGPKSARQLSLFVDKLLALGADVVLVDGALDRIAAASPQVTQGTILATGASVEMGVEGTVRHLGFTVKILSVTEHPDENIAAFAQSAITQNAVCFIDQLSGQSSETEELRLRPTSFSTLLGVEDSVLEKANGAVAVIIPGAVNQVFIEKVRTWVKRSDFAVIAKDPTNIFVNDYSGVNLYVTKKLNLLAVTVNPTYMGVSYNPRKMIDSIQTVINDLGYNLPVFDVVSGEKSIQGACSMAMG